MNALTAPVATRVYLAEPPFLAADQRRGWIDQGLWPADWITHADEPAAPCRIAFRCKFSVTNDLVARVHIAADERYELFLNGAMIGWGSERGPVEHWPFDSYDLRLTAGAHLLVALVAAHGVRGLRSQLSVRPGLLVASETDEVKISTGRAEWQALRLETVAYEQPFDSDFFSIGWNTVTDGAVTNGDAHRGEGEGWSSVIALHAGSTAGRRTRHPHIHLLTPASMPVAERGAFAGGEVRHVTAETGTQVLSAEHRAEESGAWSAWWRGERSLALPAGQHRRILLDLRDYVCAWPELEVSDGNGARLQIFWAESLYLAERAPEKGNRGEIEGKYFYGVGDIFLADGAGRRVFRGPFIRTGRYVELRITVADEPITLHALRLARAEYPLEITGRLETGHPPVTGALEACRRTIRASCHDAFIDGPYYEQMSWIGDIPQDALALYTMSRDDRPVRKALVTFNGSRLNNGLTRAQWPSRNSTVLPGFSMHWIGILHDYSWWRDDGPFVRSQLPGMRAVLDYFLSHIGGDGLLRLPFGWRFADWVPGWESGNPPQGADGVSALFHWQLVWTLERARVLEDHQGEPEMAARYARHASTLARAGEVFWNEERGLFADTTEQKTFSEHVQAVAILGAQLDPARRERAARALAEDPRLTRTTVSYSHYLFEALQATGRVDLVWRRLGYWFELEKSGFLTIPEGPEPSRSDCHGWGSHAHYHLFATILGLRPAAPGFRTVRIAPHFGEWREIDAKLPHPQGHITLRREVDGTVEIELPEGVTGEYLTDGKTRPLRSGRNAFGLA